MALLRNQEPKVIFSDNGTLSDVSEKLRTWGTPDHTFTWVAAEDALYIGKRHKFNNLYFAIGTANSNSSTMTVSLWDGGSLSWVAVSDLLDETSGFASSGFVQWEEPATATENEEVSDWDKDEMADITGLSSLTTSKEELYWIKITLSADSSASTSIKAIKQLLSDDRTVVIAHPEITNYYPSGETNFLKQHELARDEIVQELIVRGKIKHLDQIKRPDDFQLAATYRCIDIILRPIPGDERLNQVKAEFKKESARLLDVAAASIDLNENEQLDEVELEDTGIQGWQTR